MEKIKQQDRNTYEELLNEMKEDILKLFEKNKTISTYKVYCQFFHRFNYNKCKIIIMMMNRAAESLITEGKLKITSDRKILKVI